MARAILLTGLAALNLPALGEVQCEVQELFGTGAILYGAGVAIGGDVAIVGETQFRGALGAAFVYRLTGSMWVEEAVLTSPNPIPIVSFGHAVATQGDLVAVGAGGNGDGRELLPGAAYLWRYIGGEGRWTFEASLAASDARPNDGFGGSVAVDSNVALIGAPRAPIDGSYDVGAAYVFRHDGQGWLEEAKLVHPRGSAFDYFGRVALRGEVAAVGAALADDAALNSGTVLAFRLDGTEWVLEAELHVPDAVGGEFLGASVATDGTVIAAGAPQVDGANGAIYIFRHDGTTWRFEQKLSAADPSGPFPFLGTSVALSRDGQTVLGGAYNDFANGFESGAAHLFRYDGSRWSEVAKIVPEDGVPGACFGGCVALDGDIGVIGATGHPPSGKAYIYAGLSARDCNGNATPDACDIFEGGSVDGDGNGVPDECETPGDVNQDGVVDVEDLVAVILAWGACAGCAADLDRSGAVDGPDLLLVVLNWGM
jgi:hypothetical protein